MREVLLRVLHVDGGGGASGPSLVDVGRADAEPLATARRVRHGQHQQVRFVGMQPLARGDGIEARLQGAHQAGKLRRRELRLGRVVQHVQHVVHVVPRLQVVLQLLLRAFLQQRPEHLGALRQAGLEQALARQREIEVRAEGLAEGDGSGVARRHHLVAGRAQPLQDRIDERLEIARTDAEGVAGVIDDPGAGQRHDVVLRVLRRAGRRDAVAADAGAGERMPRRIDR